jgi:hypothetical protein
VRIKVAVTVELDREQVRALVAEAENGGHSYDGCKAPGRLIRRLLECKVKETTYYAVERAERRERE